MYGKRERDMEISLLGMIISLNPVPSGYGVVMNLKVGSMKYHQFHSQAVDAIYYHPTLPTPSKHYPPYSFLRQ